MTLATIATTSHRSKFRAGGVSWWKMMWNQRARHPASAAGFSCGENRKRMGWDCGPPGREGPGGTGCTQPMQAAKAPRAASTVASTSASPCALDTNPASNAEGAR